MSDQDLSSLDNGFKSNLRFQHIENIENLNKEQIIDRYEQLICSREKQLKDLAIEVGLLNEKYIDVIDKNRILEIENKALQNKLLSKVIPKIINI